MTHQSTLITRHYRGNSILLMEMIPQEFGPEATVHIDANSDGVFEHQVTADADRLFTFSIEVAAHPATDTPVYSTSEPCDQKTDEGTLVSRISMYFCSADGSQQSPVEVRTYIRDSPENLAGEVPVNLVNPELLFPNKTDEPVELPPTGEFPPEKLIPTEPGICTCTTCSDDQTLDGSSLKSYTQSFTPTEHQVELATGKVRQYFPGTGFATRKLGFSFGFLHTSLVDYNGPWGQGFSHSFNMMIIRTAEGEGKIVTADLRCYPIYSEDGEQWKLPCGFFSRLALDHELHRWILTHYSGLETVFYLGALNTPGYPISISEPNGNTTRLEYDASGLLQQISTDLGQVQTFTYGQDGRLETFTDHIQRQWTTIHDAQGRLLQIKTPATIYADIPAYTEITEKDLDKVLKSRPRVWVLGYADDAFPNHIRAVTDPRGETPEAFDYDQYGRVNTAWINEKALRYQYQSGNPDFSFPISIALLEETNLCTAVTDREGNVTLHEIHGIARGPLNEKGQYYHEHGRYLDGEGRFGLRRQITLTETGKGNEPLRPDEPAYWEQRWLHDCDCLSPIVTTEPFRGDQTGIEFDAYGIPVNYPIDKFTYNQNKQEVRQERTDGTESIISQTTYQPYAFGDQQQFSRPLSKTGPRAWDDNPIYAGLSFEHRYQYDAFGNRILHESPTVTRGVGTPQVIIDAWTYNSFGQMLTHTNPNCNISVNTYFDGSSTGGDINTKGQFGGYIQSVTRGADGSFDAVTNLTTLYKVNALGMVTQTIDPKGFVYDTEYNNVQETIREIEPVVTLRNGQQVRYETQHIYDGAGNEVLHRRSNIDLDGTVPANAFIDRSMSYDDVNNLLSDRVEVDENDANDLITRYAYDGNDDLIVTRKPEGNREFRVYDERRLIFKNFYGVTPGFNLGPIPKERAPVENIQEKTTGFKLIDILLGYPSDKREVTLVKTAFVGLTMHTYDARMNLISERDGRGNPVFSFFDFNDRQIAFSDQNGNGWVRTFDDASNVLTESRGAVSQSTGDITKILERTYMRFDEIGRQYQQVRDIDLGTDESVLINPDDGMNSSYLTVFDAGSRIIQMIDANINPTAMTYDAADREITMTDALNNVWQKTYDPNSNVISNTETELPGPGGRGAQEKYLTAMAYDQLNRRTEQHVLGLNGNNINHAWFFAYDSRNNQWLEQDAEGNFTLTTFDDHDRQVMMQRFDGDPFTGTPTKLLHYEWGYDKNSNKTEERALSDVNDPKSIQITRHAFDDLDRPERTVYPDSDDPIDGSSNGDDGIFDRVEIIYDPNSNPIQITDQREVVFKTIFDPGNRPVRQDITLPADVPGTTRQSYIYDALNRTTSARNKYAKIDQTYDAFSRLTNETQSIRLDGSGFDKSWEQPIKLVHSYDKQSNRISYQVVDGRKKDLNVVHTYDALNRAGSISAAYFKKPLQRMANYTYLGHWRITGKSLGNGAILRCAYDAKRRIKSYQWNGPGRLLAGFEYSYDRMDNALYEGFTHDQGLYDHFQYNDRYEVTGVTYRVPGCIPPDTPSNIFNYDDVFNRRQASFSQPFETAATTTDQYAINKANEYTQLTRNGNVTTPVHDRAGNATSFLVLPITGNPRRQEVMAQARWDAFNLLFDIDPGGINPQQDYRYDPLRRRFVTLELEGGNIAPGSKRYIYDGWSVVEERLFEEEATLSKAPSILERIYVNGMQIDEPILTAIDGNQDGAVGEGNAKNATEPQADQEYYFLNNRLGSIMALLDADNANRVLEYYRYTIYGEVTVLPAVDENGDGVEDTVLDLSDNYRLSRGEGQSA